MASSIQELTTESAPPRTDSVAWPKALHFAALAFAVCLVLAYLQQICAAVAYWSADDNYAHGFLIAPCSLLVLWLRREDLAKAERSTSAWGLPLIAAGLLIQVTTYILQIKYIGIWSLPITLAGGVLLFYGPQVSRIASFAILFLFFATPLPQQLLAPITGFLQRVSAIGATDIASFLGYAIVRHGNAMEVPGVSLDVEYACSGFHKLISLLAIGSLYGYLFTDSVWRRIALLAFVPPIAMISNIMRISVLVVAASDGGLIGFHTFHDPAEYFAIVVSFALLILVGRKLGCATPRYTLWRDSS